MWFLQIFPMNPYIHKDKHLFLITKQIFQDLLHKIHIYQENFQLIYDQQLDHKLIENFPSIYEFCEGDLEKFVLLLRKGVYSPHL